MKRMIPALCLLLAAFNVHAQGSAPGQYVWEEFGKRMKRSQEVTPHGPGLMGDQASLSNGALSFRATDVSLPGNDSLEVAFSRTYSVFNRKDFPSQGMLEDWEVDTPRISAVFAPDWLVGSSASGNRCTSAQLPVVFSPFSVEDFWNGPELNVPGHGGELLRTLAATTRPSTGGPYYWVTGNGQVHVSCLASIQNGSGEGFLAITPDGTRYWFDWMAQTVEAPSKALVAQPGGSRVLHTLNRKKNTLYATRVEDRFGNYVTYTYTNAWNQPGKLTRISASDGRTLTIGYSGSRISSVSDGSYSWSYAYGTTPGGRAMLTGVTQPDGSAWGIGLAAFTDAEIRYNEVPMGETLRHCTLNEMPLNYDLAATGTLTHPAGAQGAFTVKILEHGRSSVPVSCNNVMLVGGPGVYPGGNDPNDDVNLWATAAYSLTLTQKTLSGPGVPAATWNYQYVSNKSVYRYPGTTVMYPVCDWDNYDCSLPPCTSESCAKSSVTTISGPGEWTRYHHGNTYLYNEGKLLKVERGTGPSSILSTETYTYDLSRVDQAYPATYGQSLRLQGDGFANAFHRPQLSRQIAQQGVTFTSTHQAFNGFAQPLTILRQSSPGHHKTESLTYENNLGAWVIGQVKTVACVNSSQTGCSGTVASATYDPVTAKQLTFSAFGQLLQTLTYDTTSAISTGLRGTVRTVKDGKNNTTTLTNWHRGVPRTITHPDATVQSATVNARGEITSVTDELGYTTSYSYDAMGRLSGITYPTGDSTAWTPTTRSFTQVNTAEFGIPAGHWRLTETTGAHSRDTYFDGLWRPLLTRERDTGDSATTRYVKRAFDSQGRETFASYPGTSSSPSTGTWTGYDALGRVTSVSQDSELGLLTTTTQYLTGFQTRTTNPRGYQTTTSYRAFDEPGYDLPTSLSEPGGVTTTLARDVFGKPTAITRSGSWNGVTLSATRHFVYDAQQRLCKRVDPESGATLMDYDAAGNLLWTARSTSLTSTSACQTGSVANSTKSQRSYDARNRLTAINHPVETADESYTYFADGALRTASTTDGGAWTYAYNKRRLPTGETLNIGAKTFAIAYAYTGLAHVSTLTYPSGLSVGFNPNALGQPRQAGSYASGATYHPHGSLSGFTYGNSLIHSQTINSRGLPSRIRDRSGGLSRLDYTYSYDPHANITGIVDGVDANENRSLQYDARDRMTRATAPNIYGEELYDYDPLDNVRRMGVYPNGLGGYVQDYRYLYDTSQRLYRINDESAVQQWGFTHNGFGETLTRAGHSRNWLYQWNAAGRMTLGHLTYGGTTWESYAYDAHGRRTLSTRNTGTTRHQVYNRAGQLLYVEDTRDNQRIDYIHLGGKLVAQRSRPIGTSTATVTYHHTDAIQSANVETNTTGIQTHRTVRMPYGAPYAGNSAYREGPGFAGHVTDTQTNLTYMQQRYYDPVALRFLSPDPVDVGTTNGSNFNRYWYANNNPYKFVDPDGRYVESAWDAASLAVGVVSLAGNVMDGNWSAAAADVGGIALDTAALAIPVVPGGASVAIQAARQADNVVQAAADGARGADFIVTPNGTAVPTSQSRMTEGFEAAGMQGTPLPDGKGTAYTMPDGTVVRAMEPSGQAPRRASFNNANGGPVTPDGKVPQPPRGASTAERREYVRDRTHVEQRK